MADKTLTERQTEMYRVFAAATSECDPKVPVIFGDKTYVLEYDYQAILALKKQFSLSMPKDMDKLAPLLEEAEQVVALLHVGLLANHKELTLEDTGRLYRHRHITYYANAITLALSAFMPDPETVKRIFGMGEDQEPRPFAGTSGGTGAGPLQ